MTKNIGKNIDWMKLFYDKLDSYIILETSDGIERSGRFTGFETRFINLNGMSCEFPVQIELNGDPNDKISLDRITKIDIG